MLEQEGYDLMGAAFEVYNEEGHGFLEDVYQECMEIELRIRNVHFESQCELKLFYKDHQLRKKYIPDFIVFDEIVVEIKAVKKLLPEHEAQLINYLKATKKRVGYLINFGRSSELEWKRIII
jgi:GxxExxY protein